MSSSEARRVALLERVLHCDLAHVRTGIGDDAAVLEVRAPLVCSVDQAVDGVHFQREWLSFEDIGYRSTMAALSDLAAMGARPLGVMAALVLPDGFDDEELEALARGQAEACSAVGTAIVGGNLSRGEQLSIASTVLGEASRPLLRSGARAGDRLWLAGEVGLARAGLEALQRGHAGEEEAKAAWRRPRARIAEGLAAAPLAHAAIDVSDGLVIDARRMSEQSGVALVIDGARIMEGGVSLEHALYGGEDYALLVANPGPIDGFREIGRCEAGPHRGKKQSPDVWVEVGGQRERAARRGWDHFDGG